MILESLTVELLDDSDVWQSVPVSGFTIREDDREAVRDFTFTVKATRRAHIPADLFTLRRRVRLNATVDGEVYSVKGRIADLPQRLQTPDIDELTVGCYDETHRATDLRFIDSWPQPGVRKWHEVVIDAWEKYGPDGITFGGVQVHGEDASPIGNPLDSLYEFMTRITARTGWVWRVEDDVLYFVDPTTQVSGVDIDGSKFRPGSVKDKGIANVANVVFVPAQFRAVDFEDVQDTVIGQKQYFMQYAPLVRQFESGGETVYLDAPPKVFVDGVELPNVVSDDDFEAETADAIYNADNRFVRLATEPSSVVELKVIYTSVIPVLVRRDHSVSIDLFGEIDHVIRKSPRPSREEATEIAEAYLADHALPVGSFSAELLDPSVRAGWFHRVIVPEYGIDQLMPVTAVTRSWTSNGGFKIDASFARAPSDDDDLIVDMFRRLNRIESQETARQDRVERFFDVDGTWEWTFEIEAFFSDTQWIADEHELKHLSRYIIDGGRPIYPG